MGSSITAGSLIASGSAGAAATLSSYASTLLLDAAQITASGLIADATHLYPVQSAGTPQRLTLAGAPGIEAKFHKLMTQGQFLESSIGGAMAQVMSKKVDLDEKILQYLDLNRLAIDAQLPHYPRVAKLVIDSIAFILKIQGYIQRQLALVAALQADVSMLLAVATRMVQMIEANISALANLLAQICNWGLPALPSLPMQLGGRFAFPGFNLNPLMGFEYLKNLSFNFNSTFGLCIPHQGNPSSAFTNTNPSQMTADGLTYQNTPVVTSSGGSYADPTQYVDPAYIAQLQATATPVYDPSIPITSALSLPAAASIVSNYFLTPELYAENICSLCSALNSIIIQPSDPDYIGTASANRETTLRGLLMRYINLGDIVASGYDPNTVACWLFYLQANRAGRSGTWINGYATVYSTLIQPSLDYLNKTPVPYNNVLGGTGVREAPTAIPLIALLEADSTGHLLWELSYIEASLLGYTRNVTWDVAADSTYLAGPTGSDIDYVASAVDITSATVTLGVGTADYPVSCTFPQSIATTLNEVIALATISIANTPAYQSTRPQFRFVYDEFAEATLVDRYSQFWRVFKDNLTTILALDPYLVDFIVTYPQILNAAINPIADPGAYSLLESDAASRNRAWTPGSDLVPIPKALDLGGEGGVAGPTDATNGWPNQQLDAATYLARPDVQAQPIPVQIAMLRTNQSYASLAAMKSMVMSTISDAIANANTVTAGVGLPGWQIDTNATQVVPPGGEGFILSFASTVLDHTGFVESPVSINVQSTNSYIVNGIFTWDSAGAPGSRAVAILRNGVVVASSSSDDSGAEAYTLAISVIVPLHQGDVLEVKATHSLSEPQSLLSGTFLGLTDSGAADVAAILPGAAAAIGSPISGATAVLSGESFSEYTAISIGTDGRAHPIDTTNVGVTPFVDGVALNAASAAGETIQMAVMYGSLFTTTGTSWSVGGLLYVTSSGALTQDFPSLSAHWVVCVGKAITPTSFLYEPHLPTISS